MGRTRRKDLRRTNRKPVVSYFAIFSFNHRTGFPYIELLPCRVAKAGCDFLVSIGLN